MMSEPNCTVEHAPNWLAYFPRAQGDVRQKLTYLTQTCARLVEQGPRHVSLEDHLEAVVVLAQVVAACQAQDRRLDSCAPMRFQHDGVESNGLYFELAHHVRYLTERFVVRSLRTDKGSALTPSATPLETTTREQLVLQLRRLRGLLVHTTRVLRDHWPNPPPESNAPTPAQLEIFSHLIRAYAIYCAVHIPLTPAVLNAETSDAARIGVLSHCFRLLVEAFRTLRQVPKTWVFLDHALPFINLTHQPPDWSLARKTPSDPIIDPKNHEAPWVQRLDTLLWRVAAEHHAIGGRSGLAVALGRLLLHMDQPVPHFARWERRNTNVDLQAVPTGDKLAQLVEAWEGFPSLFVEGEAVPPSGTWALDPPPDVP